MSTHQQLLYHIVFSTKNRQRWLTDGFRENVFAYMAGTAKELNGFAIEVGGFVCADAALSLISSGRWLNHQTPQTRAKHVRSTSCTISKTFSEKPLSPSGNTSVIRVDVQDD